MNTLFLVTLCARDTPQNDDESMPFHIGIYMKWGKITRERKSTLGYKDLILKTELYQLSIETLRRCLISCCCVRHVKTKTLIKQTAG